MEIHAALASVEAALTDADVDLSTTLGDHHERTSARLWRNQVLVDWEPDRQAGGCLLRPDLLQRLLLLHARVEETPDGVHINAPGRVVAALSAEHAELVARLGGARRVEMHATLFFDADTYRGGQETYYLMERGKRLALLQLTANVRPRPDREVSRRTSPAPT